MMKKIYSLFLEMAFIVALAAVAGFAFNIINPKGFDFVAKSFLKNKKIVYISAREAKIKFDSGKAVFVDARLAEDFKISHIKGAVNIPESPESFSFSRIEQNFALLNSDVEIVLYCTGETCGDSKIVGERLMELGYKRNLYVFGGGMPEWLEKGFPAGSDKAQR